MSVLHLSHTVWEYRAYQILSKISCPLRNVIFKQMFPEQCSYRNSGFLSLCFTNHSWHFQLFQEIRLFPFQACGYNSKYWKSQNLDFIFELKEVSIALASGYINNAMELARYILEHAPNLKKMFILYLPHQSYVIKKINKCKIISPAASVIFRRRESWD